MKLLNNLFQNRIARSAFVFTTLILLSIVILTACDSSTDSNEEDVVEMLEVKFINSAESDYTITTVEVQPMGKSQESTTPTGDWSDNVLPAGTPLAPGESATFDLPIPNLHWSRYRLGVLNGEGAEIMLHEQTGYQEGDLPITHWGSDERTVEVTVVQHQSSDLIYVTGWSEFAGIDGD